MLSWRAWIVILQANFAAWVDFPYTLPALDIDTLDEYRRLQEGNP